MSECASDNCKRKAEIMLYIRLENDEIIKGWYCLPCANDAAMRYFVNLMEEKATKRTILEPDHLLDEMKSPISHRPKVSLKDLTRVMYFPEIDCAYCFHPKLRHRDSRGDCNSCGFFCTRFRNYRPRHKVDRDFDYWLRELR